MTFLSRIGEIATCLLIAWLAFASVRAAYIEITSVGPICASIGGGCQ